MLEDLVPLGPTGMGAVATSLYAAPMAVFRALCHQFAMMIMPVLPLVKLSRYGPVVLALAALIVGTVEPSLTSCAYRSATALAWGEVRSAFVPPAFSIDPPLDATSDRNGCTTPESQLVMTPKPCRP